MRITIKVEHDHVCDDDGECPGDDECGTERRELPAKYEVCDECEGTGYVLCEGMRGYAYSAEEFAEAFDDEEDRAEYFTRGGKYDVACPECAGARVVLVVDETRCSGEQKAFLKSYRKQQAERERDERADAYTRRMENGGYW